MSFSKTVGNGTSENRIVLVLQGNQAFWFRQGAHGAIEHFTETVEASELDLHSCCPWIKSSEDGGMTEIHLVLDSHLDEVDRVRAPALSSGWFRHLQSWRMRRRLCADFPSSSIHQLATRAAPDALSVVHNLLPEHWSSWLVLLQREGVSVTHVVSSLELLCDYSSAHEGMQGKPVLFNLPVGEYSRHLLVDDGVPLFMRLVKAIDSEHEMDFSESVSASMDHIREHVIRVGDIPVVSLPDVADGEDLLPEHMPQRLVELYLDRESRFRCVFPESASSFDAKRESKDAHEPGVTDHAGIATDLVGQLNKRFRKNRADRWQLTSTHRFAGDLLQASALRCALQLRIRQLHKATLICAWIAAVAAVVASVHGVASARDRARLTRHQQQVADQVDHLSAVASGLNRDPAFVVRSMERIAAHQTTGPAGAGEVLARLAEALDGFPELVLNDLSWSVFYDEPHDTAVTTVEQATVREHLWEEGAPRARLQVELGGTVITEQGLRVQQRVLEDFIGSLKALPGVTAVTVVESPVSAARSSERHSLTASVYRLSLLMGAS